MKKNTRLTINTKKDHTFIKPVGSTRLVDATKKMHRLYLGRKGGYLPIFVMRNPRAVATVILLPGGKSELGEVINGEPADLNFMSIERNTFFNEDFNVIIVYRPTDIDINDFNYSYRERNHVSEIINAVDFANKEFNKPIWLIGISLGTISTVSTASKLGNKKIKGMVLASTPTNNDGSFISDPIDKIKIPVLMVHHSNDSCDNCSPSGASSLFNKFTSSIIKKFIMINEGSDPTGKPCSVSHWHGFVNYQKETIKMISTWIKRPT